MKYRIKEYDYGAYKRYTPQKKYILWPFWFTVQAGWMPSRHKHLSTAQNEIRGHKQMKQYNKTIKRFPTTKILRP